MSLIHFLTKSQLTLGRLLIKLILKFIKKKKKFQGTQNNQINLGEKNKNTELLIPPDFKTYYK